jgi:hypothetical protein
MRPVAQALECIGASTKTHSREVETDVDPLNKKGVPDSAPHRIAAFTSTTTTLPPIPSIRLILVNSTKTRPS